MRYIIPLSVGALYLVQGVYHTTKKEWGMAIMWYAYGLANIGLCLAMAEGQEGH